MQVHTVVGTRGHRLDCSGSSLCQTCPNKEPLVRLIRPGGTINIPKLPN